MGEKKSNGKSQRVTVPVSTTIVAGNFYYLDGFLGMALSSVVTTAEETDEVVLNLEAAEYETDQINTDDAFAKGAKVYFDESEGELTTTSSGNLFAGKVTVAKDANDVIWFNFMPNSSEVAAALGTAKGHALFNYPGTLTAVTLMDGFTFNKAVTITKIKIRVKTLPGASADATFDVFNGADSLFTATKHIASTDTANEFVEFTPNADPAKNVFAADGVLKITCAAAGTSAAADAEFVVEYDQSI